MKFLMNTKGFQGAEMALKNWLIDERSCPKETMIVSRAIEKFGVREKATRVSRC